MPVVAVVAVLALVVPAGCASTVVGAGAIVAAVPGLACSSATPEASPSTVSASPTSSADCLPTPSALAGGSLDPSLVRAPDQSAATAVAAALAAVGRGGRYVAEGNGPVNFDCSGLTSYAWRQAGVSLVDYSYTQREQTQDIPRSLVQPGDLVFWFGGSEHHVAIVTAVDGSQITIAEAANPAAGIRTRLLGGSWDEAYLTGFGRVIRS